MDILLSILAIKLTVYVIFHAIMTHRILMLGHPQYPVDIERLGFPIAFSHLVHALLLKPPPIFKGYWMAFKMLGILKKS